MKKWHFRTTWGVWSHGNGGLSSLMPRIVLGQQVNCYKLFHGEDLSSKETCDNRVFYSCRIGRCRAKWPLTGESSTAVTDQVVVEAGASPKNGSCFWGNGCGRKGAAPDSTGRSTVLEGDGGGRHLLSERGLGEGERQGKLGVLKVFLLMKVFLVTQKPQKGVLSPK